MNVPAFANVSADLALAVYLEPHADRRRVLLLGEVEGALAAHLSHLTNQLDIIDPSTRERGQGQVPELPFDDESFDLVVVADVEALPEPRRAAFRELHRVTARSGLLVLASAAASAKTRRGEAPSEALERALRDEFEHVRALAQAPLGGYVVSDLEAGGAAELSIDTSLVRDQGERPERLLAIASDARQRLEPRLWVQLPPAERGEGELAPRLAESLRKAEEDARRALAREGDLLRELERERKAREANEAARERNRALERKLLDVEADYDDAVGRVRYFERVVQEREADDKREREHQEQLQAELRGARAELGQAREKLAGADAEREAARADAEAAAQETADAERRLAELSLELTEARREFKRQETVSRDLLEELRGLEQRALAAVEHDARVSELEAERERAMQRALEAEVARESAQMRVDELRAQLEERSAVREPNAAEARAAAREPEPEGQAQLLAELTRKLADAEAELGVARQRKADEASALYVLRGERNGLRLRLAETEQALLGATREEEVAADPHAAAHEQDLDTRLALAEARAQAAIEALGAAEESLKTLRASAEQGAVRADAEARRAAELQSLLERAERRVDTLERELEEADRFAEDHAEDAERVESLERELSAAQKRQDELEDDVRSAQDELFSAREELRDRQEQLAQSSQLTAALERQRELLEAETAARVERERERLEVEMGSRIEQLTRRERELRSELEDGHAALAEARAILSQLAVRVGADTHDLPAIMQALDQQSSPPMLDALRTALAEAQAARSDNEYQLSRLNRELELKEGRIRELEESLHAHPAPQPSFEPPEV